MIIIIKKYISIIFNTSKICGKTKKIPNPLPEKDIPYPIEVSCLMQPLARMINFNKKIILLPQTSGKSQSLLINKNNIISLLLKRLFVTQINNHKKPFLEDIKDIQVQSEQWILPPLFILWRIESTLIRINA